MYWIRYYEKLSKGYTDQSDVYLKSEKVEKKGKKASKKASKKVEDPVSNELYVKLKKFAKQVVESELQSADITKAQVKESKRILKRLGQVKTVKCFNKHLMNLMTLSPRKCRYVNTLLATSPKDFADIVTREETLITAMEAFVGEDTVLTNDFSSYGMEVYIATDEQKKKVLEKLSPGLQPKVKQIYRVIHKEHKKRFDNYVKNNNIKTIKQFWHGSKNENWFSIAVNGLQLNPNAAITGKMFGYGIYFATRAKKSIGYTSLNGSYWANGNNHRAYLAVFKVAYKNPKHVYQYDQHYSSLKHVHPHDALFAHAGQMLLNDEIIVYNECQTTLQYIIELEN